MPLFCPPPSGCSRRRFLATTLLGGTAVSLRVAAAQADEGPTRVALLADTHIDKDPARKLRGVNLTRHLEGVASDVLTVAPAPDHLLINGDCAVSKGLAGDYAQLQELVGPISQAGIPVHYLMGNHDDRDVFLKSFNERPEVTNSLVDHKLVEVLETPEANWIFLDTLMEVDVVTGEVGDAQLRWLDGWLEGNPGRPVIIVMHHTPQFGIEPGAKVFGVKDTDPLFAILAKHGHVKAVVYGHSHTWRTSRHESGLHLINLPPVAYVFKEGFPSGWVLAEADATGISLTLRSLDAAHPQHLEEKRLAWR
ncbi:MAG: hypothetical protein HKN82_07985 [Akkermansiaceae bacterium]|nr:hypothetical protein [Akkermansiaceae bacterium]NNM29470.1 hypothetical protein [Akkermansiaceae bacterium]